MIFVTTDRVGKGEYSSTWNSEKRATLHLDVISMKVVFFFNLKIVVKLIIMYMDVDEIDV